MNCNHCQGWNLTKQAAKMTSLPIDESLCASRLWLRASGRKGLPRYSLSDHIDVVVCLDLEAAVIGPEVNRYADACDAALVDLVST